MCFSFLFFSFMKGRIKTSLQDSSPRILMNFYEMVLRLGFLGHRNILLLCLSEAVVRSCVSISFPTVLCTLRFRFFTVVSSGTEPSFRQVLFPSLLFDCSVEGGC